MGAMQYGVALLRSVSLPLLVLASSACMKPAADARANGSWAYEVEAPATGSRTVVVEATFDNARTDRIAIGRESASFVREMQVKTPNGYRSVARKGTSWVEPSCQRHCTLRYRVDLGELAQGCGDDVDCARRVGEATLSPSLAWLVHPIPKTDVPVDVHVRTPNATQFISGMHGSDESGRAFTFRSYDLDEGSFTAFGPMRRYRVDVPGPNPARIDVAILGKVQYGMPDTAMRAWIARAAEVVKPLFGKFPVDRTTLFVVPARGEDEVVFGKVLSLAGASVVLVVGDKMPATATEQDWVLVHELFHLGFPTFRGEGRWLGEGLATYYEPILRARAGWTTDAEVFKQFARNMPRGVPERGSASGLAQRSDLDSIYWGGALFCFAADVRIREETRGRHSLDDVVRAALERGGDATKVWTVAEVVHLGDEVTGTHVLSSMYERYAARGERIDLDGLLTSLGVDRGDGSIDLANDKPLAWIRKGIIAGPNAALAEAPKRPDVPGAFRTH
ncbi:hypothetical protein AKJ09_08532 [Labilithrix luteola]|uniref:Peptidase M61 catalytic domain-containing protein n=1 Tax=Labilithrix luteola TaxID=1391654 RepID=A0A0K1Q816_9BACT|nr:hypothetical protein [Labilithrix luteola]AKV01869.1 hypothetical protein AKJ09_08532 [Labilithrix luteola]